MFILVFIVFCFIIGMESKDGNLKRPWTTFKKGFSKVSGAIFKGSLILSIFLLVIVELLRMLIMGF